MLADTLLADTDDDEEDGMDNEEEEDIDNKEEDIEDEDKGVDNNKKGNKDAINNMPPKLKPAAATPPKMTV